MIPRSLTSRLILLLLGAVLSAQMLSTWVWVANSKSRHHENVLAMANQIGYSISTTLRYFNSLPTEYRHMVLDQLRRMGGTRFFVTFNREFIRLSSQNDTLLKQRVLDEVNQTITSELGNANAIYSDFSLASQLKVFNNETRLMELPPGWGHHALLVDPERTPILVVQYHLEADQWLYLATPIITSDNLQDDHYLSQDRLWILVVTMALVFITALWAVRWLTRPLKRLAKAAEALGRDIERPPLRETGSAEMVSAARAFNAMQGQIQKYIADRESLFSAISHDLKTPITRLRLRAEMLEDASQRDKFVQDLGELETMVQGALQCMKDTAIHENKVFVSLPGLLQQLCDDANLTATRVSLDAEAIAPYWGKPIALKRAITNVLDNALFYGQRAEISLCEYGGSVYLRVRDFGPGIPPSAIEKVFEPYVRLERSRSRHTGGSGLGLSIVKNVVQAHEGHVHLSNHPQGGLIVELQLPRHAPDS